MSSIRRSVQVIDLLARRGPLGVRAVAQLLSLPLGSVHRILIDLAAEEIVERTPAGEWELSYRLLTITGLQLDRLEVSRLARPYCERIAEATRETVNVSALSGTTGVCIDKVRGNEGMQLDARIGSRGPLHCGGSGKAMLAYISPDEQERVLASPLVALTPNTITDPLELVREIGRIRQRGYSIDNEEVVLGVHCVGMPILDRSGRAVGGISITGPARKVPGPALDDLVAKLSDACGHVSRRLGYSGQWPPVEQPAAERPAAGHGGFADGREKTRRLRRVASA
jgi:DNA-binding IclR family transcriptional regulator